MSAELAALFAAWWWKISLTGIGGWIGLQVTRHYKKKDDHQKALEDRLKDTYTKSETINEINNKVTPLMEKQIVLQKEHSDLEAKFESLMDKINTILPEIKIMVEVSKNDIEHIKNQLNKKD